MKKTKKASPTKKDNKGDLKELLKKKMPGCFYSTPREGYEEGRLDELVKEIKKLK